jgi:multidrug resistance efflux pump
MNPYIPPGGQSAGIVRYNTNMNVMEVYDGQNWKEISNSYANVSLTGEAEALLDWARRKRNEEAELEALAKEHPAINIALANLKKAKMQLDATIILSKEHDQTTS